MIASRKRARTRRIKATEEELQRALTQKKVCSLCRTEKPLALFHRGHAKDGYAKLCKECAIQRSRKLSMLKDYGLSIEGYNALLAVQGGVCAICKQPEVRRHKRTGKLYFLSIDHNHLTGAVRGLLCQRCNWAIGCLDEDTERLQRAIKYLARG